MNNDEIDKMIEEQVDLLDQIDQQIQSGIVNSETITKSDEKKDIISSKEFIQEETDSYLRIDKEFEKFLCNFVENQSGKSKWKRETEIKT